jgi:Protein of unknown function (DUF3723)
MQQSQVEAEEREVNDDRFVTFRGTAIVRIKFLQFGAKGSREISRKNVEILKKNFRTQGILRLEPEHHILAVIDEQDLDHVVKSSETTHQALLKSPQKRPPELIFPPDYRLKCLHGQYRILAARETLPPQDKW